MNIAIDIIAVPTGIGQNRNMITPSFLKSRSMNHHETVDRGLGFVVLELLNMREQFIVVRAFVEVMANHFISSLDRLTSHPQADHQAGNQGCIHLDSDAVFTVSQQVATAQNTFEPTKEQFNSPAMFVCQCQQLAVQLQFASCQYQDDRLIFIIEFPGVDLHDAYWLTDKIPF